MYINDKSPVTDMEVADLEKEAIEDSMEEPEIYDANDQAAEPDANSEVPQDTVGKFQQNHWQFSDEGKRTEE